MTYTKTAWVDEVLAGGERFAVLDNAGAAVDAFGDFAECQISLATAVTTSGTPVNAANLNNLENGIDALSKGAAVSVKGVAGGAAGDVADIVAATDGHVLRRSGTGIGFGTLVSANIGAGEIKSANIGNTEITPAKTNFFTDSAIYSGRVAAAGSAVKLPSGWSSAKIATGKYEVTHNLGTANYTIMALGEFSFAAFRNKAASKFEINMFVEVSGSLTFTDSNFHFTVIRD